MRLINCSTLELEEFFGSKVPPYAILSHTWGNDEVTFMDLPLYTPATQARAGYQKIEFTCKQAIRDQLKYAWVDTCCIDKRSSSELSEAINSMFAWYWAARRCYAYLSDVVEEYMGEEFRKSRWFTRGWTLQELLAPTEVVFYNCNWHRLGLRHHHSELISKITGIDEGALRIRSIIWPKKRDTLGAYCVAKKMSWASSRDTTRIEDMAYCLLGMFEINMPLLYGEGDRAFHRLQEEIIRRVNDDSIFAWGPRIDIGRQTQPISDILSDSACYNCSSHKILASSPKDFASCGNLEYAENPTIPPTLTSLGLTIRLSLLSLSNQDDLPNSYFVGLLNCSVGIQEQFLGILIHAESNNNKSMTVMKRGEFRYRSFDFSTVLLSARHAQGAVDQTITLRESREGYPSLEWEWKRSKVDIVIETSATLLDMGYQLTKPICWIKLQSHRPEFMEHESIWDPDVMILSLRSNSQLNPLIEFRFEAPLNSHFSTLSIFLHVENSSAIAMKGGAFSDDDRLNIFSSLHPDAAQNDNEDVTIQSQAGQIHRVRVGVRKTTVHQRRIFELSADAVLASTSSSLGGSVSSDVSFSLDVMS